MKLPIITERLILRTLTEQDSQDIFEIRSNPEINKFLGNRKELELLAEKFNIQHKINFLGNIVDVEDFMQKLDVFVSPIVVDGDSGAGVSNAIVEAMLTKTPVCAYDASAIGEIVINSQTGYLVEPRNTEAMAKAILQTIENKEQTKVYVENAYNLIIRECDPQNYSKKLISLYEEL